MLKHRGPDEDQYIVLPNAAIGHTRLAIIDVAQGRQPMMQDDAWIVFNGEIYNFQSLRGIAHEHLTTDSDTEVVLRLYQSHGPDCVSLLDGMFAFAIADADSLFLARDPLGIKPLYYALCDHQLYFASEIKALTGLGATIREFPAGHWWHSELGLQRFFSLGGNPLAGPTLEHGTVESQTHKIRKLLDAAVLKRMIADPQVDVGVSLSGGLDSSLIAAISRQSKDNLKTFVVGIENGPDLEAAEQAASFLGTDHHAYQYSLDEMLSVLNEVIYHLESYDAALIRSAIPNYFLARLAAEHVKVILTGEGADELYAGYAYLAPFQDPDRLQSELVTITGQLHNTNLQRADRMSMAFGLEARVPFLDKAFVDYSLALPAEWKLQTGGQPEKLLLRQAYRGSIPDQILMRKKQKFSDGAGSIDLLAEHASERISDTEFSHFCQQNAQLGLRSKEEALYYQIFRDQFGEIATQELVGRTRSVTENELQ
jgi:asparagine synthase (glutamine-hydrolysing)